MSKIDDETPADIIRLNSKVNAVLDIGFGAVVTFVCVAAIANREHIDVWMTSNVIVAIVWVNFVIIRNALSSALKHLKS